MTNEQPVKSYDAEFKQRTVKLGVESDSQARGARDLGISKNTLYSWIRQYHSGTTPAAQRVAPNILERHFEVSAPNRTYSGDITYIPTAEGWLYLAVVIDLFSRAAVGWSLADHLCAELVSQALVMAIQRCHSTIGYLAPLVYEQTHTLM